MRARGLVAVVVAALGCAGVSAYAAAPTGRMATLRAHAASTRVLHLGLGSEIVIRGINVYCYIGGGHPVAVGCAPTDAPSPSSPYVDGDYGIAISDGQTYLQRVTKKGPFSVVKEVYQPSVNGATFTMPSKGSIVYVSPPTAILVGGSHIFCAVSHTAAAGTNIACGLTTAADGLHYPAGTYVVGLSNKFVLLAQAEANGNYKTITLKNQP